MFDVPGSKAWIGNIRTRQEAINIPGPISENLTIWVRKLKISNFTIIKTKF